MQLRFSEDFESTEVGEYPSSLTVFFGGNEAVVSNEHSHSGSHSLMQSGASNWSRTDGIGLSLGDTSGKVAFEAAVYFSDASLGGTVGLHEASGAYDYVNIGFRFAANGEVSTCTGKSSCQVTGSYGTKTWLITHAEVDFNAGTATFMLNGSTLAKDVNIDDDAKTFNGFATSTNNFSTGASSNDIFVDDLKVWY